MAEKVSLITDEMKKLVGVESEPITYEIEAGHIRQFADAIGDPNPLYTDEAEARKTPYGGIIAPPTFLRYCEANPLPEVKYPVSRGLDAGSDWEYYQPVYPGDRITAVRKITDFTQKEGRLGPMLFETTEVAYTNQFDEVMAKQIERGISY
ncbi:MAG: MaoC family dehydratase N-terminal domain-containing protein [Dehalococcoidia bacterium]